MKSSDTALVNPAGQVQTGRGENLPTWLSQTEPTGLESQLKDQFAELFHDGRPVLADSSPRSEDDKPETSNWPSRRWALGDLSLLMPTLSRPDDRVGLAPPWR